MQETLPVYRADDFTVIHGVAEGEPVSFADELIIDDSYALARAASRAELRLERQESAFRVLPGSAVGEAGRIVHLDSCLTLMGSGGDTLEALILVEVEDGAAEAIYLLPLAPLAAEAEYRLVGIDRHAATRRFAEVACVAFARGTRMTMATGEQRPIETLRPGDRLLTRDDGARPLLWMGQRTLRAQGDFAPVLIRKGALNNENDLVLAPDNRVFVWQRQDAIGAGRSELLVKARHLVNGETVVRVEGGFVDYFQLLFEQHQIIFAEGIAAESLLVDPRTREALPDEVREGLMQGAPGHGARAHLSYDVAESLLSSPDAVELLRRAAVG
ncbi:Hint domain-containing protein [Pseudoroseicyclus tamaricis]|uniref:Hint domain-containing protein n=1 Tax=Pseudoroseicyclus tamaricis TaxID=2705421 RepID=A0A6B2JIC4_9RHOB|nr:Hint domain-containing protein [Pseudoroseicyclus tamaricis]NDV01121.1 Hint domain-containing protein [Pseudoroseicyclus tamaricis]